MKNEDQQSLCVLTSPYSGMTPVKMSDDASVLTSGPKATGANAARCEVSTPSPRTIGMESSPVPIKPPKFPPPFLKDALLFLLGTVAALAPLTPEGHELLGAAEMTVKGVFLIVAVIQWGHTNRHDR